MACFYQRKEKPNPLLSDLESQIVRRQTLNHSDVETAVQRPRIIHFRNLNCSSSDLEMSVVRPNFSDLESVIVRLNCLSCS